MKRKQRRFCDRVQLAVGEMLHMLGHSSLSIADIAHGRLLQLTKLEERVLMSASPMAMVAEVATVIADSSPEAVMFGVSAPVRTFDLGAAESDVATDADSFQAVADYSSAADVAAELVSNGTPAVSGIELIVIDSRVQDADTLLGALLNSDRDFRFLRLDVNVDGVTQITEKLEEIGIVSAIHLLTHGTDAEILLGSTVLNGSTLAQHAPDFLAWQHSLTANADLLLYGCDVAETVAGKDFVDALAELTTADVAASSDITGGESLLGDWDLEYVAGSVEASMPFQLQISWDWNETLAITLADTNEFAVNANTTGTQITGVETRGSQPAVSLAADGSYVVVWSSPDQDGSGWNVYARRFDATGTALTGEIIVNQTPGGDQKRARVASSDDGSFTVTWTNGGAGSEDVYFRRFAANGTAVGVELRANNTTTGTQKNSVIALDRATSQFVIAWQGEGPGDTSSIFFRRFSAAGKPLAATDQLVNSAGAHLEQDPAIAMQTAGGFVIAYERGDSNHLYFQRFNGGGAKVGSETEIDNPLSASLGISIASDAVGNFTVAYREESLLSGIWQRSFNADGTESHAWSQIASGDAQSSSLSMLSDGSYIVTWQKSSDGDGFGIYAQRFNSDTSSNGAAFQANQTTTGTQSQPGVAMLDSKDFVIVWSGLGTGDSEGVFARQFNLTMHSLDFNDSSGGIVNEYTPVITSNGGAATSAIFVAENTIFVTKITATDADLPAQALTYSISGGLDASKFFINSTTGVLTFVAAPNFEVPAASITDNVYNVVVSVTDGLLTDTQSIAVTIMDVNESPTAISLTATSVRGFVDGATVSNVRVDDPDNGDSWTFTVNDNRFEVVSGVLRLKSSNSIDPIAEPSVSITLTATDSGGEVISRNFTLIVTNVNSPPTLSITPLTSSLQENADMTTAIRVATITVTDDSFGTNSITLTGTDASSFEIVGTDLYLKAGTVLDFESQSVLNITVNIDDSMIGLAPDYFAGFSLTITDVNEAPSMLISQTITSVLENTPTTSSIVIATIDITDDALGTNTLSLTGADASNFQILSDNSIRLKPGTQLDAETKSSYRVIVNLRDSSQSDSPIRSQVLTLVVDDFDEAPTADAGGPYAIFEGDTLSVSSGLSVDPEGLPLTYAWDIDGDGVFADATGGTATLTWNQLNALASKINDNGSRAVSLKVTDAGGNSTIATTTLVITNTAPSLDVTGNSSTSSGVPYVINVASSDPGNDTVTTYRVNWGDGVVEDIPGVSKTASHAYQAPGGTRNITVNAIDEDGTFSMNGGPLVVTVLNTVPSVPVASDLIVPGLTNGAVVGTLNFIDPDFGDSHAWTLSDDRFQVVDNRLMLKKDRQLNPATESTVSLTVTVADASGANNAATLTLRVNNPPVAVADLYAVDGTQQLSISSPTQGVLANDSDADSDALTAMLASGPLHAAEFGLSADGTFWYRPATGFSGLDTFSYQVTDGENFGLLTTVRLVVNQPPSIEYNALVWSVPEHQKLSAPLQVGTITISDDGIGTNTLTLVGPDAALFQLDASNNLFLRAGLTIDFLLQAQFEVTTVVNDPALVGSPDATQTLILSVLDLDEIPTATAIPDVVVLEDAEPGTISTASSFHDADNEQLTYLVQVMSQTSGLLKNISVNQTTGIVSYGLNTNANGSATIRVTAKDPALAAVSRQFQLIVQPVNDAPLAQNYFNSTFIDKPLAASSPGLRLSISDADGDLVTVTLVSGPESGSVVLLANGSFAYTPDSNFQGIDTFRFVASDGILSSNVATATISVVPQFIGPASNGSSNNSNGFGSQSSTTPASSVNSASTTSSSSSNSSSTSTAAHTRNSTSASVISASSTGSNATFLLGANKSASGKFATPVETTDESDDDIFGVLPTKVPETVIRIGSVAGATSSIDSGDFTGNDFTRRTSKVVQRFDFDRIFSSSDTNEEMMQLNAHRESLYRQLSARVVEQSESVAEQLEQNINFKGRVVGSIGVVTTGFSVGYLFWAIRGGMLLSGLLAQVPAWTMLDPLLVIDGDQKDEDKESLQNLMDCQQAKMNKNADTGNSQVTLNGNLEA